MRCATRARSEIAIETRRQINLTELKSSAIISHVGNADVAQQVERRLGKAEVGGSSPLISFFDFYGQGAEMCLVFICKTEPGTEFRSMKPGTEFRSMRPGTEPCFGRLRH